MLYAVALVMLGALILLGLRARKPLCSICGNEMYDASWEKMEHATWHCTKCSRTISESDRLEGR